MTEKQIQKEIEAALEVFYTVGLRYDSRDLQEQEELGDSYHWDDGEDTGAQMDGTAAIDASRPDALALIKGYRTMGKLYLIASDLGADRGEDPGEIIIPQAIVARRLF
jgi:hypothetical protein